MVWQISEYYKKPRLLLHFGFYTSILCGVWLTMLQAAGQSSVLQDGFQTGQLLHHSMSKLVCPIHWNWGGVLLNCSPIPYTWILATIIVKDFMHLWIADFLVSCIWACDGCLSLTSISHMLSMSEGNSKCFQVGKNARGSKDCIWKSCNRPRKIILVSTWGLHSWNGSLPL